jgi:hypothetical protein
MPTQQSKLYPTILDHNKNHSDDTKNGNKN